MREIVVKIVIFILVFFLLILELVRIEINLEVWLIVIKVLVLILTLIIIVVEVKKENRAKKICRAFIYQHKENRSIVFCENDQGDETRDFRKVGEGTFPCDKVNRCSFVK